MNVSSALIEDLVLLPELGRTRTSKQFEERLRMSIASAGLAEPLKVARDPNGHLVVIDGALRYRAIQSIRESQPDRFETVPVYVYEWSDRFEIRFQSDIYQDLLPSQIAEFVEHLHESEHVSKTQIASYVGVSAPTLRNYTGLARMLRRGGLFAQVVGLMDLGVVPSSNPYAWLRLTDDGIQEALVRSFAVGVPLEAWISETRDRARRGGACSYAVKFVEEATGSLPARYYRKDEGTRKMKRDLGLRRSQTAKRRSAQVRSALDNLRLVSSASSDPVLRTAAQALDEYLS
jgi:hypothetical protein